MEIAHIPSSNRKGLANFKWLKIFLSHTWKGSLHFWVSKVTKRSPLKPRKIIKIAAFV